MDVYDQAVKTVPVTERLTVYELYLARAHEYFGLGKVGPANIHSLQNVTTCHTPWVVWYNESGTIGTPGCQHSSKCTSVGHHLIFYCVSWAIVWGVSWQHHIHAHL